MIIITSCESENYSKNNDNLKTSSNQLILCGIHNSNQLYKGPWDGCTAFS